MQKTKISTKFSQIILYISLFVLSIASLVAFYIMGNIESSTQNMIKNSINIKLENKINNSFSIGVTNAVAIAENKNIKDALKNMDKEKAYEILNNLVNEYAKFSDHKNAKIHIHTKDVKSFLRSWVKDHNGDELSSFRHTINKVKMTHKEVLDIEVGWANLVIRAIVPIMDDKEYLGSLEFIQDFNYIRERLESENKYLLSLIDKKLLKNQPDRNNVIGKYALVQERFNKDFFKVLKEVNFDKLIKNGYINKDGKYFSIKPIIGFNDSLIGYYIVGQDYKEVQKILLESQNITISFIILMILMALVIAIALNITVKELIVKNLSSVTDGLGSFFKFLNKESDDFKKIDIEVNDEIGQMANEINTNIKVIEDLLDNEKQENWIQNGLLGLRSSLSGEINIDLVSNKAIAYLCEYLKGGVGVLYVYRESLSELELSASYAYTRDKNESSKVKLGEGVIGQVALQKTPIILTDIDTSNITITTSFTDTKNLNIYTYPLIYQDNLLGVVEIGTQKLFNKNELRLLELCDEIVATSLYTSIQNKKVVNLLDDSEKSNQTLKEKQSLLEHANSQMQEQQAQLEEVNSQMQEQQAQLEEVNSQMEEQQVQLRQSESELKLQNKKLEDSNRYKSEFLANMSHELRTPLNSVILLSSMLNENKKGNLNEDDVKKAKIINSSGNELLRLINDVLDLSKIEAGKMELMIDTFNSSQFIENIKDLFEASVLVKELKIIVEDRYNNYIVNDEDKLSQVLRNFISNSLKFTHEGFIKIIIDSYEDNKVKISVQDTGIGIPNEKLNSIFNAFEQVDGSTSRKYGGTGLGLSITKEIVSLMGGELSLESKENEGSTFSIIIPNKSESNSIKDIPKVETEKVNDDYIKPLDGVDLNDKKILVVDDDMRNIFTLVEILEDKGAEVITASNGKESIQRLEEHKDINLVLMDIMMPVMDGFEAIEHIRDDETTKDIPIIAVTAKAMNQDKERCLSLGANDFLTKPLNLETFSRVVNAWIK